MATIRARVLLPVGFCALRRDSRWRVAKSVGRGAVCCEGNASVQVRIGQLTSYSTFCEREESKELRNQAKPGPLLECASKDHGGHIPTVRVCFPNY